MWVHKSRWSQTLNIVNAQPFSYPLCWVIVTCYDLFLIKCIAISNYEDIHFINPLNTWNCTCLFMFLFIVVIPTLLCIFSCRVTLLLAKMKPQPFATMTVFCRDFVNTLTMPYSMGKIAVGSNRATALFTYGTVNICFGRVAWWEFQTMDVYNSVHVVWQDRCTGVMVSVPRVIAADKM